MQGFGVMDFGRIWERVWRDLGMMLELGRILQGVLIMENGKVLKDLGRLGGFGTYFGKVLEPLGF